jgi:hypothetical protein
MGQYYKAVNLDKKELLHPHEMTDGFKLLEFGCGGLTMTGLAVLLACSNGRGGGDLHSTNKIIGSWAGDRIAIIGDYAEPKDYPDLDQATIDAVWGNDTKEPTYKDISRNVLKALCEDSYLRQDLLRSVAFYDYGRDWSDFFTKEEIETEKERLKQEREHDNKSLRPDIVIGG